MVKGDVGVKKAHANLYVMEIAVTKDKVLFIGEKLCMVSFQVRLLKDQWVALSSHSSRCLMAILLTLFIFASRIV